MPSPGSTPRFNALPWRAALAAGAGVAAVFAFAPFGFWPLAPLALLLLFYLLRRAPRAGALTGLAFGCGFFGLGVSWIYYSLHDFGYMPVPLAVVMVVLFVLMMALYPMLVGLAARFAGAPRHWWLTLPAGWVALEWVRGWMLTGFPWLALGYSQIDSPLAGYAPYLGVYGVSLAVALTAAFVLEGGMSHGRRRIVFFVAALALWVLPLALDRVAWVRPYGPPLQAALVQGNVPLALKWAPEWRERILQRYVALSLDEKQADLIVWPETAAPFYVDELAARVFPTLQAAARERGQTFVLGAIERRGATPQAQVFNSVVVIAPAIGLYRKQHLVPFGEFLPLRPLLGWLLDYLHIPMSDFSRWQAPQPALPAGSQRLGISVCYEDAFGEEVIQALPAATVLVNVSEDAWFGDSLAPHQHLEIARMRARETRRPLLRATNTGVSAIIAGDGRVQATGGYGRLTVVRAAVQPTEGATPYILWGNGPIVLFCFLVTVGPVLWARFSPRGRRRLSLE